MARTVTWLHLSDLHAWEKRNWDAKKVLDTLQRDLRQMEEQYDLHPSLVFFTGDAVQGQMGNNSGERLVDQYLQVKYFFDEVLNTFTPAVATENLFLVPGNHDVNRASVPESKYDWLDKQTDIHAVIKMIEQGGIEWKGFMERLREYQDFLATNGYNHLLEYPQYLVYSVIRTINGVDLRIVGLNSAWSCGREKEKGRIWAGGEYQLNYLALKHQNTPISIVLSHHPTNWLVEYEEGGLSKQIAQDFRFYLHGHEHDNWVNILADGHTRIAAAACYERSDRPNGYNFVRLDLEAGTGEVWLRQYDSIGRGWIPRIIYGRTDNNGRWPLNNLQWLERLEVKPGKKAPPAKPTPLPSRQGFEIKTTILKNLISEDRVETLKLRTLRANQQIRQIVIDPQPKITGNDSKLEEKAYVPRFYSLPGRVTKTPEHGGMFQIDFGEDEMLLQGKEYAVLIGYTMEEKLEKAFDVPGIIARQPVGTESLVIEVHFPRGWRFLRDAEGKPKSKLYVYDQNGDERVISDAPGVKVTPLTHDFGVGDTDYFRVKIIKPPQDTDVLFDWEWQKEGSTKAS